MARRFLELGARVAICGRRAEVLQATASEFEKDFPERTFWQSCDIRDPEAIEALCNALWKDGAITSLVNNAAGNFAARTESLSTRAIDAILGIVLHGTSYVTLACGKRWIAERQPGTVLSIVATYAWTGSAYVVPSAMAKAGVLAMTQSLAVEWGRHGIRLNAIAPGPFPTQGAWDRLVPKGDFEQAWRRRIPLGRFGEHQELADLASFLLSEGSGFINGEVVVIDGGEWLKGAGQFSLLEELDDEAWAAMRPGGAKA